MKITTKFDINDLLKRKTDSIDKDHFQVMEVMETLSQTCYAGTQVFYLIRPIIAKKRYEHALKREGKYTWETIHGVGEDHNSMGWRKYREDELIKASKHEVDIITGKSK